MQKKMSTFEKVFREEGRAEGLAEGEAKGRAEGEAKGRAEGEAKGRDNTVLEFIQGKRDYHVPDIQIHEEVISKVFVDFKFFLSGGLPDSPMKPF